MKPGFTDDANAAEPRPSFFVVEILAQRRRLLVRESQSVPLGLYRNPFKELLTGGEGVPKVRRQGSASVQFQPMPRPSVQ